MNVSFRVLFFLLLLGAVFFSGIFSFRAAAAAPLTEIKNVRVHTDKDKVRIVVDADGEVDYRSMTLAAPGRVVVDLSGARLSPSVAKSKDINSRFATKVRVAQFDKTTVRVVVETQMYKNRSNYEVFFLEGGSVPYRVVMDFGNLSLDTGSASSGGIGGKTSSSGANIDFGWGSTSSDDEDRSKESEIEESEAEDYEIEDPEDDSFLPSQSNNPSGMTDALLGKCIVIDPGHGGSDTGAIGPTGVTEKSIALRISKRLKVLLEEQGASVIMTRTTDKEVSPKGANATDIEELQARCDIANKSQADIFLSVHLDAFLGPEVHGTTGFYYEQGSEDSKRLADIIKRNVLRRLGTFDRGTKPCAFYVCRHTNMPATLLETAFLSNPREEQMMNSADGVEKAAQGIAAGIVEYFQQA